jgi:3',5'-cyclic AMP phosphodiesterase CpdA
MRLVILGDLHYSVYPAKTLNLARDDFFYRLFKSVKNVKPDLVVAIGDVSHSSKVAELQGLKDIAHRAGIHHYIMVNGNHDLTKIDRETVARHNHNPKPGYFTLYYDKHKHICAKEDATHQFIILDTCQPGKKLDTGGYIDHHQLEWLNEHLPKQSNVPAFVFGHHPLQNLTKWANLPGMFIKNTPSVWKILSRKKQGSGFYFCGHNHANSEERRDNWLAIQTGAPLGSYNFRVVDIHAQALEHHLVEIEGGTETVRLGQLLSLAQYSITRIYARRRPSTTVAPIRVEYD